MLVAIVASGVNAQGADDTCCFVEATLLKHAKPVYPLNELISYNEGMAEIEMMIDIEGKVFAPTVIRSTSKRFEKVALAAARKYVYEPATYNGKPVQSRTSVRIRFLVSGEKEAVSRRFASAYRKAAKELDKAEPKQIIADKLMQRMKSVGSLTSYALARYNLVALRYATVFGDIDQQIEATHRLLMFDKEISEKGRMLDEEMFKRVRHSLFFLLVKTQRYAEALDLYYEIQKQDPMAEIELNDVVVKIENLKKSGDVTAINIRLGTNGYVLEKLFKNSIMFTNTCFKASLQ